MLWFGLVRQSRLNYCADYDDNIEVDWLALGVKHTSNHVCQAVRPLNNLNSVIKLPPNKSIRCVSW